MTSTIPPTQTPETQWLATVPQVLLALGSLATVIALGVLFHSRFGSIGAALLGAVTAGCFLGGLFFAYSAAMDAFYLRFMKREFSRPSPQLQDKSMVALEAVLELEGPALTAPFSGTACAAYTYEIAHSGSASGRRRQSFIVAQGFHMLRTSIRGDCFAIQLGALPRVQDDLIRQADGRQWGSQVVELVDSLKGRAMTASDPVRFARSLVLHQVGIDEISEDYLMGKVPKVIDGLQIMESTLPVGETLCLVGSYDEARGSLMPHQGIFGPQIVVYRGTAERVLHRLGQDVNLFLRFAVLAICSGLVLLSLPWIPIDLFPAALTVASTPEDQGLQLSNVFIWALALGIPVLILWLGTIWSKKKNAEQGKEAERSP